MKKRDERDYLLQLLGEASSILDQRSDAVGRELLEIVSARLDRLDKPVD